MSNTEKLKKAIERCGLTGIKALNQEIGGELYRDELLKVLEIKRQVSITGVLIKRARRLFRLCWTEE